MRSALQNLAINAVVQADTSGTPDQRALTRKLCNPFHDHRQYVLGSSAAEWEQEVDKAISSSVAGDGADYSDEDSQD